MRGLTLGVLVTALVIAGCSGGNANKNKSDDAGKAQLNPADKAAVQAGLLPSEKSPMAPDWELPTVDGGTAKLSDYRGKVVILDFWDTWCPPCKREIPGFIQLQKKYGDKGLMVIGAAFGKYGPDAVKKFAKEHGMNYPVVVVQPKAIRRYGNINSIPTTFIIDSQGRARGKHVGYTDLNVFENEILALLPGK